MKFFKSDKMSLHKRSASENDLKLFVESTLQEYGVGITKMMTLKTLHQVRISTTNKSIYFHSHGKMPLTRLPEISYGYLLGNVSQVFKVLFSRR